MARRAKLSDFEPTCVGTTAIPNPSASGNKTPKVAPVRNIAKSWVTLFELKIAVSGAMRSMPSAIPTPTMFNIQSALAPTKRRPIFL
ncbi:MAG: hypothetical protein EBX14_05830 [Proteobacteria bacterium]|nr:hypothetical protein [Pseudomonadota bacterium]